MKTIYSLQEFRQAVLEIADSINETYTQVEVKVDSYGKVEFRCYINGKKFETGSTMEESLQNMKDSITKPAIKNIDVEIEIEKA